MSENPGTIEALRQARNDLFNRYDDLNASEMKRYDELSSQVAALEASVASNTAAISAQANAAPTVADGPVVDPKSTYVNLFVMAPGKNNRDLEVKRGTSIHDALKAAGFNMSKEWIVQKRVGEGSAVEITDLKNSALHDDSTELYATEKVGGAS